MKTATIKTDIVIVGGGLAGLTTALLLAKHGIKVAVIERVALETQTTRAFDVRTTAIAAGSARVLNAAGVWADVLPNACPITHIEILDGPRQNDWPVLLNFPTSNDQPFGWIVDNQDLRVAQARAVAAQKNITLFSPATLETIDATDEAVTITLADGQQITTQLLIGADGRGSQVREHYRIRTRGWPYHHTAVIATIAHTGAHNNIAIEHFRADGPFAVLPMTNDADGTPRSAIVWSERPATARDIMAMNDDTFKTALATRLPERYGDIVQIGKRAAWLLTLQHAEKYTGTRMALLADAAHGIHPIAGQGLNLGMRDIADLAELILAAHESGDDLGAPALLKQYERARRADNMGMIGATDMLTALFGRRLPGIPLARRLGLRAVEHLPPLKRFFINQAMGGKLVTESYRWG